MAHPPSRALAVRPIAFVKDSSPQQQASRVERLTRSPSFIDEIASRQAGPVMVAFDGTQGSLDAMAWARGLVAGSPGDKLVVAHVVVDPRGLAGTLTASGPVKLPGNLPLPGLGRGSSGNGSAWKGHLQDAASAAALNAYMERVRMDAEKRVASAVQHVLPDVEYEVRLPQLRGPRSAATIAQLLTEEAERANARALVLVSHGPGAQCEYGSVVRWCCNYSPVPLILVPPGVPPPRLAPLLGEAVTPPATQAGVEALHPRSLSPGPGSGMAAKVVPGVPGLDTAPLPEGSAPTGRDRELTPREQLCTGREVVLVVSNMTELESHWQWVADNLLRVGDTLRIWHFVPAGTLRYAVAGPALPASGGALGSLTTALTQALRARGLADVKYEQHYMESGGAEDVAELVRRAVIKPSAQHHGKLTANDCATSLVVVLNYSRPTSQIQELLSGGSVAAELARVGPGVPLVLLQPPLAA